MSSAPLVINWNHSARSSESLGFPKPMSKLHGKLDDLAQSGMHCWTKRDLEEIIEILKASDDASSVSFIYKDAHDLVS